MAKKKSALSYEPWQVWWKEEYPKRKMSMVWYKVFRGVRDGTAMTSPFGKRLKWRIGAWQVHRGRVYMCVSGLHVTTTPRYWPRTYPIACHNPRVFVVDARGIKTFSPFEHKAVCHAVKLLYEVHPKTLKRLRGKS
jgi:hypothetical protein